MRKEKKPHAEYWGLSENPGHMSNSSSWSRLQIAASITCIWEPGPRIRGSLVQLFFELSAYGSLFLREARGVQPHTSLLISHWLWHSPWAQNLHSCTLTECNFTAPWVALDGWRGSPSGRFHTPCVLPRCPWGLLDTTQEGGLQWLGLHVYFAIWARNGDNSRVDTTGRKHCMALYKVSTPGEGQCYSHVLCRRQGCRKWVIYFKHCFRRMKKCVCVMFWMCLLVAEECTLWMNILFWEEGSLILCNWRPTFTTA